MTDQYQDFVRTEHGISGVAPERAVLETSSSHERYIDTEAHSPEPELPGHSRRNRANTAPVPTMWQRPSFHRYLEAPTRVVEGPGAIDRGIESQEAFVRELTTTDENALSSSQRQREEAALGSGPMAPHASQGSQQMTTNQPMPLAELERYFPPQIQMPPEYSVFVGRLGPEVDESLLWNTFSPIYNSFIKANLMRDKATGRSKGYAFVRFANEFERDHCLENLREVRIGDSLAVVSAALNEDRRNADQRARARESYIQGQVARNPGVMQTVLASQSDSPQLTANVTNQPLLQTNSNFPGNPQNPFQQHPRGPVMELLAAQVAVPYSPTFIPQQQQPQQNHTGFFNPPTGFPLQISRGFQQVQGGGAPLGAPGPVQRAAMARHQGGVSMVDPNNVTVFVGALPPTATYTHLQQLFSVAGEVTNVHIPQGRGCGFVKFRTHEEALNAIISLQGTMLLNSRLRLAWGKHAR